MSVFQFDRDRTSREVTSRIDRDLASGEDSGVEGTPTFYVNDVRHDGMYDVEGLRAAIQSQLKKTPAKQPGGRAVLPATAMSCSAARGLDSAPRSVTSPVRRLRVHGRP